MTNPQSDDRAESGTGTPDRQDTPGAAGSISAPQTSPLLLGSALFSGSAQDALMAERLAAIEERLTETTAHTDEFISTTCQHLLKAGGKRARPMLVVLAAQLGDPRRPEVVEAATVVELTHLATLYHDDVMDDAPVRRGATSAHVLWGNSIAILAGDMLLAQASRLVSELGGEALRLQARVFDRLVTGQMHELRGPQPGEDPVAHYLQVLSDKTGSLIAASGEYGVRHSGADPKFVPPLQEYGEKVGVAFQLADDIIDLMSDGSISGKTPGTDLREGVPTLPALYARQDAAAGDRQAQHVVRLLDADLSGDEALEEARQALAALPATSRAQREARRWAEEATAALDALPEGPAREGLRTFAEGVVSRTS
ncbi:polyprenyl synthetase family protein [Sediminivirga luteola]|uniref:Geranylgeranyl pyrophosphate synthase n=1 Tax=Sediminivirga luteola TaxID=1774748 RepID=A0A8J2TXC1_9MICO|nr:geranylgeranyl pyrophosphate synthase [Sediminivirga luteola]